MSAAGPGRLRFMITERLLRTVQMVLGLKLFNLPVLMSLRTALLRPFFRIGHGTRIADNVSFENHHGVLGHVECGARLEIAHGVIADISGGLIVRDDVWISEDALILTHDHRVVPGRPKSEWPVELRPKVIEEDAWVGARAVILPKAARIGKRALVAAGSVVTKDVADYAIVAGVPARPIGSTRGDSEE
jgi:acetyltransferase-like isoleucine patch superfamily enzyme